MEFSTKYSAFRSVEELSDEQRLECSSKMCKLEHVVERLSAVWRVEQLVDLLEARLDAGGALWVGAVDGVERVLGKLCQITSQLENP